MRSTSRPPDAWDLPGDVALRIASIAALEGGVLYLQAVVMLYLRVGSPLSGSKGLNQTQRRRYRCAVLKWRRAPRQTIVKIFAKEFPLGIVSAVRKLGRMWSWTR